MKNRRKAQAPGNASPRPDWGDRLRQSCVPLAVCGLAFAVYSRSLFCGFIRDDFTQFVYNPRVQSWQYLPQLLTSHLWSQMAGSYALFYRPLFSVWMLMVYSLGGLAPWFWHLSSILLHVACTYLVYLLGRRFPVGEAGASVAATLFAVHPIHVDAVTWVSASNEILFSILALGAMLALLTPLTALTPMHRGQAGVRAGSVPWPILLSAAMYFTGLFAKETGAVLIVLLVPMAWILCKNRDRDTETKSNWSKPIALAGSPYLAATALYATIRWSVMHGVGTENGEHTWREVFFTSPSIMLFYLRKLIAPMGLSGGYVNPIHASPSAAFWIPLAAILLFVVLMTWLACRKHPVFWISAALILLPLLPALAAIRLYPQGDMTHDRYLYLPSVGLCLLAGAIAQQMLQAPASKTARIAATALLAVVVAGFSVLTFTQQRFYDNNEVFLQREIDVNPANSYAYGMLGNVYMDEGKTVLGLKNYRVASELAPGDPRIALFLARGLFADRQYTEAEAILNRLLLRKDFNASRQNRILLSLANVEIGLGKLDSAERLLAQVEQADASFPELHWAFGVLYRARGQLSLAQAEFEKEYRLTGDEMAHRQSLLLSKQLLSPTPPGGNNN